MKMLIKPWIGIFGALHCIFSDDRTEFVNDIFWKMCEKLSTAWKVPGSNGICEYHHHIVRTTILLKICNHVRCSNVDIALSRDKIILFYQTCAKIIIHDAFYLH